MKTATSTRRSLTSLVQKAIQSGNHRVDIAPDGKVTILPLNITAAQADDVALDAEIAELINNGHATR